MNFSGACFPHDLISSYTNCVLYSIQLHFSYESDFVCRLEMEVRLILWVNVMSSPFWHLPTCRKILLNCFSIRDLKIDIFNCWGRAKPLEPLQTFAYCPRGHWVAEHAGWKCFAIMHSVVDPLLKSAYSHSQIAVCIFAHLIISLNLTFHSEIKLNAECGFFFSTHKIRWIMLPSLPLIPSHNYRIENMSPKQDLQYDLLCTFKARKRRDS